MKVCSNCDFKDFQKKDIVSFGLIQLSYKCPNCNALYKTDIKSLIVMLIGILSLLICAIWLHFSNEVQAYQNNEFWYLVIAGSALVFTGIKMIKLVPENDS